MIGSKNGTWRPGDRGAACQRWLCRGGVRRWRIEIVSAPRPIQPLMLLHGVGMTADLNWGAAYAELCRRFRVVAPDLPGHGRGIRPWPTFGLEECADHMVALADSLGIDKFVACGYSMGSLVAQLIWRGHPDRVERARSRCHVPQLPRSPTERLMSSLSPAFAVAAKRTLFCAHSTRTLSARLSERHR